MQFRAKVTLVPTGQPYSNHPLFPKWVDYSSNNHSPCVAYLVLVHQTPQHFHIFARRQDSSKGLTYLCKVAMSISVADQFDQCIEEAIACALTAMVNAQFCYLFTVGGIDFTVPNKKIVMQEARVFYLSLKDHLASDPPLLRGELLPCQYNDSALQPLSLFSPPFQFTLNPLDLGAWKSHLKPIQDDTVKYRRSVIFNGIAAHLNGPISTIEKVRLTVLLNTCKENFKATYSLPGPLNTLTLIAPPPPAAAPPPLPPALPPLVPDPAPEPDEDVVASWSDIEKMSDFIVEEWLAPMDDFVM